MADLTINDQIMKSLKALSTDKSTSTAIKQDLDLQTMDWMNLLVAQLKNQDMYNQTDTTEMAAQMAQFSQIQAIQSMVSLQENIYAMNNTSYAASLIGKEVTVASIKTTATTGGNKEELITEKGVITGVTLFEGEPQVYIGDKKYSLNQIMVVGQVNEVEEATEETEETEEVKETENTQTKAETTDENAAASEEVAAGDTVETVDPETAAAASGQIPVAQADEGTEAASEEAEVQPVSETGGAGEATSQPNV